VINHFRTLGVSIDAEDVVIRAAWAAMLKRYHPDVDQSEGAAVRTTAINEAYRVLRDPAARLRHCQALRDWDSVRRNVRAGRTSQADIRAAPGRTRSAASGKRAFASTDCQSGQRVAAAPSSTLLKWAGLILWAYVLFRLFNALNGAGTSQQPVEPGPEQAHATQFETP